MYTIPFAIGTLGIFVNLVITTQRIKAITKRFLADIPEEKRNGNDVSSSIFLKSRGVF